MRHPARISWSPTRWLGTLSLALVVAAASACASTRQAASAFDEERSDQIRISVDNRNFNDATVWAIVQGSRRQRLGTVRGKNQSVFTLPFEFPANLQLEFDLVAGARCLTREIPVDPGDALQLEIAPVFRETAACR